MKKLSKKGFTLVELLVAITILGIITAIAIPQLRNLQDSNRDTKYKAYGDSILTSGKLYTDSYSQDMFGNNSSGCVDIPYSLMKQKNLLKDLKIDNSTCAVRNSENEELTFVRVYKSNNQYRYELSIACNNAKGNRIYEKQLDLTGCNNGPDKTGPEITITPNGTGGWKQSLGDIKVKIADEYGLLENIEFKYAWTKDPNNIKSEDYIDHNFKNKQSIELTTLEKVITPPTFSGTIYLVVVPVNVRDINGNRTAEKVVSKPFRIDKEKPVLVMKANSSNGQWTPNPVIVSVTAQDKPDGTDNSGLDKVTYKLGTDTKEYTDMTGTLPSLTKTFNTEMNKEVFIYAKDKAGNKLTKVSAGYVRIDKTPPTISNIKADVDGNSAARYLHATIKDNLSQVVGYQVTTTPTVPTNFTAVTATGTYNLKYQIPASAGTYYIWGKDAAGNINALTKANVANVSYNITYDVRGGVLGANSPTSGPAGGTITIPNPSRAGWTFMYWIVTGNGASISGNKLKMGNGNVQLRAVYKTNLLNLMTNLYNNTTTRTQNSLGKDDAGNTRFIGANPKNYVLYNGGEVWRIIGNFNVSGKSRTKIMRNNSVTRASWDSSASNVGCGYGYNEWSQSDIAQFLSKYYGGSQAQCRICKGANIPSYNNCGTCNIKKLDATALSMIETVTWNTGSINFTKTKRVDELKALSAKRAYDEERGSKHGSDRATCYNSSCCNVSPANGYSRTTTWNGLVGLPYASDFIYASTDSSCRSNAINNRRCANNNWMHYTNEDGYWGMSPITWWNFDNAEIVLDYDGGTVTDHWGHVQLGIKPTVYLKNTVMVTSEGDGSAGSPYPLLAS